VQESLDQAVTFFHDLFGFQAVTRQGPFPMDAAWKKTYRNHAQAGQVSLVMQRAGWVYFETPSGPTVELNSYPNGKGYEQHHPAVKRWQAPRR
jgi:catechol 2,3-dioxygenase-like lactoylglutathione lyase family enzyme